MKLDCNPKCVIKVFTMGDSTWRDIQCLPVVPLYWFDRFINNGVHLNGTINWLALHGYSCSNDGFCSRERSFTVEHFVIVSLDLSTETYTELLLPRGFAKVPRDPPKIVVLMDCLCFCHDFEETHFVIWKMKDFGVQESWIQLFKISYENFDKWVNFLPLYLSENGDTLILTNYDDDEAFIYNCRDNRVKKIGINNKILWGLAKDYVESLVSTH
jgi:F-box interacting protein